MKKKYEFVHNVFLDCCVLNPTVPDEIDAMSQIFKWAEEEVIVPIIPHSVLKEVEHVNTPSHIKEIANRYIYTKEVSLTPEQLHKLDSIEQIIVGKGKKSNYYNDALNIFIAEDSGVCFLTVDNRLIKKRKLIREIIDITICKPSEFISIVKEDQDLWFKRQGRYT